MAAGFYIAFLVRGVLKEASEVKPIHAVYLKILTNHMQIVGAISAIDFSFPSTIKDT